MRRAAVVGTGLIGGSIGLALRRRGWHVTGDDRDPAVAARALELGALDAVGIGSRRRDHLRRHAGAGGGRRGQGGAGRRAGGIVTDVGSVKASIVDAVADPRFVGGHPMAGSEQEGVDGADPDLFAGAVWVLTPTAATDDRALTRASAPSSPSSAPTSCRCRPTTTTRWSRSCRTCRTSPPRRSCGWPTTAPTEHRALLRLAAGGFRDMTRIASGHPGIWPDICAENRDGDRRRARRPARVAHRGARRSSPTTTATGLLSVLEQARAGPGQPARRASPAPATCARCASPCPTAPGCSPRSRRWPARST